MSATINIHGLCWSTPSGRAVISNLNLAFGVERCGLVGRNGVGKSTLLRLIAGDLQPLSGRVAVTGAIATLRQSVQVEPRETIGSLFGVTRQLALLARAERGDASIEEIANADWTLETRIAEALARVGLSAEPQRKLVELSGGQRTRAALAAMIFRNPDFLLLDEPTNNLDAEGRAVVADLLRSWRGGAIIVSHDRDLLAEMDAIVELTSLGATRYGGNWVAFEARKALELAAMQQDLADAEKRLDQSARAAQTALERKARKDAAGRKKASRGDMPKILMGALKRKAENTGGGNARLTEQRKAGAQTALSEARARIEVLQPLTVALPSNGLPAGRTVLKMDGVSAGYDRVHPILRDVSLTITGPERIAIAGPNGAGKTTLLNVAAGRLAPFQGAVSAADLAMLDQSVSLLNPLVSIRDNFRRINPDSDENACRASLARFMFRADAALQQAGALSGGQMLRAGLACVLGVQPPPLLILDEPANHLDIDSIAAVEAGLVAYDGALLVVSHDRHFLDAIGITRTVTLG